ncbi:MAG: RagB/SusD family nutrient uptake outer membrane protein, partial [Bacteroidales bacterium]|nr:RagB/SusD family nutrient uptake outer membrane protein [Bacteroidales bacterium]
MRRILKYTVISAVIFLSSCADFLDVIPKHNLVGQNAIVDETTAINALRGIYSYFQKSDNGYTIDHWANGAYLGGLCVNEIRYGFNKNLSQFSLSPVGNNAIGLTALYNAAYCIVNAANNVIYHTNLLNNIPEENKIEIIGEARFMRGYGLLTILKNYSHFWNIESPYGPIIRETPTTLETLYLPRSSVRDGYEFIIEDFRAAVKDSHDEQISVFRANRHVAKGFLAEILLMRGGDGDAEEALVLLNELTNPATSPFKLHPSFSTLFNAANDYKNGGETMLAQGKLDAETIETYSTRTSSTLYAGYSKAIASGLYCIH